MLRRIPLLLAVPTLIAGSLILLWVVSCFICVRVTRGGTRQDASVLLAYGNIIVWPSGGTQAEPPFEGRRLNPGEWMVQVGRVPDPPPSWMTLPSYHCPLWVVMLPTILGPIVWLDRHFAARKALRQGLCPVCGYDLRATPDGRGTLVARCPECGNVPSPIREKRQAQTVE